MKTKIIIIASMALAFTACKKDKLPDETPEDTPQEPAVPANNYYPLTTGSYWVYAFESHQTNGTVNPLSNVDTVFVTGDTVINGESYQVFEKSYPYPSIQYRRVNAQGEVVSHLDNLVCPPNNAYSGEFQSHYGMNGTDTIYRYWKTFGGYADYTDYTGQVHSCILMMEYHQMWPNWGGNLNVDTTYHSAEGVQEYSFSYSNGGKVKGKLIAHHVQ